MHRIRNFAIPTAIVVVYLAWVGSQVSAQLRYSNPKPRDQWTESDWKGYEEHRFRMMLTDINRSPALRVELEISEEQRLVAKAAQDQLLPELQALSEKSAPDYKTLSPREIPGIPKTGGGIQGEGAKGI